MPEVSQIQASVLGSLSLDSAAETNAGLRQRDRAHANTEFEALFLRQSLELMMPKEKSQLFGGGNAGQMWQSFLIDTMATLVAESGKLGINAAVEPDSATKAPEQGT